MTMKLFKLEVLGITLALEMGQTRDFLDQKLN